MGPAPLTGYRVRVDGHLGSQWTASLAGWTLQHHPDGTTTITGPRADQAQLHGLLAMLRDVNATLLCVAPTGPVGTRGGATPRAGSPGSSSRRHRSASG